MQPILFFGRRTLDQLFVYNMAACTFTFTDIKNEVNQTELTVIGYRDFDTGVNTR